MARILISNLLKNAIFHSASDTEVEIEISSKRIEFKNPGIRALEKSKIFSRFKGAEKVDSTSLGLAISKAIVDKMDLELTYYYSNQKHHFSVNF
ncbi:ATP-binding protein [Salinimicrobium sp. ASW11-47]|nr:ATP-binding protein [Salinimicrobium sediminilitoris]